MKLCILLLLVSQAIVVAASMTVHEINDKRYVDADDLEAAAGVAVKTLPGMDRLVVCHAERCAMVDALVRRGEKTFLEIDPLARALGAEPQLDAAKGKVVLKFLDAPDTLTASTRAPSVGQLVPDFRLPLLDGGVIALSELRGKRVLINSWASW